MRCFEKKKKSSANYFFLGKSSKLCTLLSYNHSFCFVLLWSMSEIPTSDPPPAYQNDSNSSAVIPAWISQNPEPTFELLLTLIYPLKCVCTSTKKTKNMKPELENKGPYEVLIDIGWDGFLKVIAEKLTVVPFTSGTVWDITDELDSNLEDHPIAKKVCIPSHLSRFSAYFLAGKTG